MTSTTIRDPQDRTPGARLLGQRWDETTPIEHQPVRSGAPINNPAPRTLPERLRDAWAAFWALFQAPAGED